MGPARGRTMALPRLLVLALAVCCPAGLFADGTPEDNSVAESGPAPAPAPGRAEPPPPLPPAASTRPSPTDTPEIVMLPSGPALRSTRVVRTRQGPIQGLILSMDGAGTADRALPSIEAFLGVPYATPPVGGNRFSPTRALSPWDTVRMADRLGPACPQRFPQLDNETAALEKMPRGRLQSLRRLRPSVLTQSEDCLYLNIYTPASGGSSGSRSGRPVMVYIHGGSFSWGTGGAYDGSVLASYADVVVVTLNYRLGVLGFLNANPSPGGQARVANYGLMDQVAALHWLQQNVALFGGDPTHVTLFGHGAGAACIHFLMMSPTVTPGLFQRAILMSGSAYSPWALVQDPARTAVRVASRLNCTLPTDLARNHEDIVDCLRAASLNSLLGAAELPAPDYLSVFGPSVDGVVIKRDLVKEFLSASKKALAGQDGKEAYADGAGADAWAPGMSLNGARGYGLLCGVVTNEALFRIPEASIVAGLAGEQRDRMLRTYVRNTYTHHLSEIFSTVVNEYTDWERTAVHPINTRDATVAALSDAQFVAPMVQTGDAMYRVEPPASASPGSSGAAPAPVPSVGGMGAILRTDGTGPFFYVFDYQTKDGDYPQKLGPAHGEELAYVFGAPLAKTVRTFLSINYTKEEVTLSEAVMTYWTNFARTGNPNQDKAKQDSKLRNPGIWEEYDQGHQKYLAISLKPKMKNHFRAHQMSIWLRLVPELHRAGQEDVVARHNLFRNHNESSLYDGIVRPDPLGRTYSAYSPYNTHSGHIQDGQGLLGHQGRPGRHPNDTVRDVLLPVTMPTCLNISGPFHPVVNGSDAGASVHGSGSNSIGAIGTGSDLLEPESLSAYSTALGVTLVIGCTLLILNVLIFAGVFYQRDRTRLQVKTLKQQQRLRGTCEDLTGSGTGSIAEKHLRHSFSSSVILDIERDKATCGASQQQGVLESKSPVVSMKSSKSGLAYSGQPPNYTAYMHQVPPVLPTEFADNPDGHGGSMIMRHSFHAANTFRDGLRDTSSDDTAIAMLGNPGQLIRGERGTATLPRNIGPLGTTLGVPPPNAPNGCAASLHHTLPRPPPPPRVDSRPVSSATPNTQLRLPQAALGEMRV